MKMAKKADEPNEEIPNLTPVDDLTPSVEPVVDLVPAAKKPSTEEENAAALRAEFVELNRQALSENAAELARLRQENEALKNATPSKSKPDNFSEFMEQPRTALREELQAVVAPLLQFREEVTRERNYNALKLTLVKTPKLKNLYDKVAPYVDQMMSTQEATPQNLQASIISAYGAHAAGLLGEPTGVEPEVTPTPTVKPPVSDTTPPHIPPSPPPAPRKASGGKDEVDAKVDALTETERAIARAQGFGNNLRQYVEYRDADPDVSTWGGIKK